jgi:hypothetical protein
MSLAASPPIVIDEALALAYVVFGMMEASAIRSRSTPCTLSSAHHRVGVRIDRASTDRMEVRQADAPRERLYDTFWPPPGGNASGHSTERRPGLGPSHRRARPLPATPGT